MGAAEEMARRGARAVSRDIIVTDLWSEDIVVVDCPFASRLERWTYSIHIHLRSLAVRPCSHEGVLTPRSSTGKTAGYEPMRSDLACLLVASSPSASDVTEGSLMVVMVQLA